IDLAPALGEVFGPQPELPELEVDKAKARLLRAFQKLWVGLGEAEPAVLVLGGVEHADAASLGLVEAALQGVGSRLLVVLTAPDQSAFGPLAERPGATVIELQPLGREAVKDWVAHALETDALRVAELAGVLHDKCGGNSELLVRLLEHFAETGVLR